MTKRKKLAKNALKHPERFSYGELAYFQKWLEEHKQIKAAQKAAQKDRLNTPKQLEENG